MDHDAQMRREYERQQVVEQAVREADQILLDASDGTPEMTDALTADMASGLVLLMGISSKWQPGTIGTVVGKAIEKVRSIVDLYITDLYATEYDDPDFVVRNCLWVRVALKFAEKAAIPFQTALMRWDIEHPAKSKEEV